MKKSNAERLSLPGPRLGKASEVGHRESLVQPNIFVLQRRLKEIEQRTQRVEEMLSAIFLSVEDIREAVGADGKEPGGPGFRLPNARALPAGPAYPWWKRLWYSFWRPEKLRRPRVSRW